MIRVKVFPGPMIDLNELDEDGYAYLEENSTIGELLKILKIPKLLYNMGLYTLNYKKEPLDTVLKDEDVFSFISPLAGG